MRRLIVLLVLVAGITLPAVQVEPAGAAESAGQKVFTPARGVTFNSPLADRGTRRAIFNKILRSIDAAPRGSTIRIFSWNFLTRDGADALLRAQKRGVTVRLLMDNGNNTAFVNSPYRRLRSSLHKWNKNHPKMTKSWAKTCKNSCRGKQGAAHAKFYLFSQSGKAKRVVMQGSANFTVASTNNQWNDIYTTIGDQNAWSFYDQVFREAAKDQQVKGPMLTSKTANRELIQFPLGKNVVDPVMQLLNKVKCRGATNTASHRTRLRIAPDVIRNDRGMRLAKKIRQLWNQGCDIKIGYTVVGIDIGRYLRSSGGRGPVPMKHLVQDFNGDGEFDNYFHLKAMSIIGNVGGKRGNYVVLNGSSNWSGLASVSDENIGVYWNQKLTKRYDGHIDYWYTHFPHSATSTYTNSTNANARVADRSDQLVFGSGANAVYEDGTKYSTDGVDPYASLDLD